MNEIIVAVKWKQDVDGNAPDLPSLKAGEGWEDITGNFHPAPIYLLRARVGNVTLSAIQSSPQAKILAKRVYTIKDGEEVESSSNFDELPNTTQLKALKDLILDNFDGVDEDMIKDAGEGIIAQGLTRQQIIKKLAKRWRSL